MTILFLKEISLTGGTQCRDSLDQEHIAALAEVWEEGAEIPPITVFHDGTTFWLADGFHRYHAAQKCHFQDIEAEVISGTRTDAVKYAVGANATHGLPRTNKDKQKSVQIALKEFPQISNLMIAELCKVSDEFVRKMRSRFQPLEPEKVTGKDGKTYPAHREKAPEPLVNVITTPLHSEESESDQFENTPRVISDDHEPEMNSIKITPHDTEPGKVYPCERCGNNAGELSPDVTITHGHLEGDEFKSVEDVYRICEVCRLALVKWIHFQDK